MDEILKHIEQTSDQEASKILEQAKRTAQKDLMEKRQESQKRITIHKETLKKEVEAKQKLVIANAHRQAAQEEFSKKEELIQQAMAQAWESLKQISGDAYNQFLLNCLVKGKEATSDNCSVYCVRSEDRSLLSSQPGVTVKDPQSPHLKKQVAEGGGGIIVQSADGARSVDYTFKGILERKNEQIRIGVAKRLFSEE